MRWPPSNSGADGGMRLEALELVVGREVGIVVVEMHDEADRRRGSCRSDRGTSRRRCGCRAASRTCAARARLVLLGRTSHSSLRPMPYFCGSRPCSSSKRRISTFDSEPRAPSAMSVYLPRSSMPRVKLSFGSPSRPTPMSPVATPATAPLLVVEHLGRGEAGIDLDAELGRLLAEPAAERCRG